MFNCQRVTRRRGRRGIILPTVLIVVAILALVGSQFLTLMNAEDAATEAANRVASARVLADSGIDYASFVLSYPQNFGVSAAEGTSVVLPAAIYHNPTLFHLQPVESLGYGRLGYFSVIAPQDPERQTTGLPSYRFGVIDEASRINVNALLQLDRSGRRAREALTKLFQTVDPNLNAEETAAAIVNWNRSQNTGNESTSSDEMYYAGYGYSVKYGKFESLEELLLIRNLTPRLVLGNDRNRNGIAEPDENDFGGAIDPGLAGYLTIYSRERNLDSTGQPRIYINDPDWATTMQKLTVAGMSDEFVTFVNYYRSFGPANADDGGTRRQGSMNPINSLASLIDAEVRIQSVDERGRAVTRTVKSPLNTETPDVLREQLPILYDKVTTRQELDLPARVNINSAPRAVLMTLPGLEEEEVQQILDSRPGLEVGATLPPPIYQTPAWLITEAGFRPEVVAELDQYVTARSQVYRFEVVGYYEIGGPKVRLEAVIDTNFGRPRILYWRDITELGRGPELGLIGAAAP